MKQWERFQGYPGGVLAHSTHVHGIGTYEGEKETRRVRVTLASPIPPELCAELNLGYRAPQSIRQQDYVDREEQGVLWVPRAGARLFHLQQRPRWAGSAGGTMPTAAG